MKKDLVRWLVIVLWSMVLLVPMMAPKLGFDTFELDFDAEPFFSAARAEITIYV